MNAHSPGLSPKAQHIPLPDLARQFAFDGIALARAEAALARARLAPKIAVAKIALSMIAGAAIVAMLAAIGLIVGLVLALSTLVGPLYAGLIIGGMGLAFAGALFLFGAHQLFNLLERTTEKL